MWKRVRVFLLFLATICCINEGFSRFVENKKFYLEGTLIGLKDGTKVYLVQYSCMDTVGISYIKKNGFRFSGKVPLGTEYYFIRIDSSIKKVKSEEFLLINSNQRIEGSIDSWPNITLKGSIPNEELNEAKEIWNKESEPQKRILKIKEYILAHPNSVYTPDLIRRLKNEFDFGTLEMMCDALSKPSKESYFGTLLMEDMDSIRKRNRIKEGATIPDFFIADSLNKLFSLSQLAPQSRYTLIDFWASWCTPCREEIPNLKKAYQEFNSRGFNILSVALSDKEKEWKKAIQDEKCPWFQGRDKINKSYKVFDIPAIPAFILIDSLGKIVSFHCPGSVIKNFGPPIKGIELFRTMDSLLGKKVDSSITYTPLQIGGIVPGNVPLGEIINHKIYKNATVGDFRGKLLILDFWSVYCATCIYSFPHQKKLQDRFPDSVVILPVGFDGFKKGSIRSFVDKSIGSYFELKLPTAIQKVNDSILMKLFPFGSLPHLVWISNTGQLLGITDNRALTEENITELLKGRKLPFKEPNIKKRWVAQSEDILSKGGILEGSRFSKYNNSYTHVSSRFEPNDSCAIYRWCFLNHTMYDLYKEAYREKMPQLLDDVQNKRIVFEGKLSPASFLDWKDIVNMDNWDYDRFCTDNLFCYELTLPSSLNISEVSKRMEKDLNSFYRIESRVAIKEVDCIRVMRSSSTINEKLIDNLKEYKYVSGEELYLCLNANFWLKYPILADELKGLTDKIFLIPYKNELNKEEIEFVMKINSIQWHLKKEKLQVLILRGKS